MTESRICGGSEINLCAQHLFNFIYLVMAGGVLKLSVHSEHHKTRIPTHII